MEIIKQIKRKIEQLVRGSWFKPAIFVVSLLILIALSLTTDEVGKFLDSRKGMVAGTTTSFLANWDSSINAYISEGDSTAYTDSTLPSLVDGGYDGSQKALQASKGDTLKYATASNLNNEKVEYSMQLKNQYELNGEDMSVGKFQMNQPWGVTYDQANQMFYIVDSGADRIIKTNWDNTVWREFSGGLSSPRHVEYDSDTGYLFITDNNSIIKTKFDGTGFQRLGGFSAPVGIDYDSSTGYIYVANNNAHNIVKTKIDGTGWTTFGSGGSGVNQFKNPFDVDYDSDSGYLYVADRYNNRIVKTKFDGTGWTTLSLSTGLWSIQYDSSSDYIYAQYDHNYGDNFIRTKIDGSDQVAVGIGGFWQKDFYFDVSANKYYISQGGNGLYSYVYRSRTIIRSDVDGSNQAAMAADYGYYNLAGRLNKPLSVFYSGGYIYVMNSSSSLIKTSEDGKYFRTLGNYGNGNYEFNNDSFRFGLFYDQLGDDIYVANDRSYEIIKTGFDPKYWQTNSVDQRYGVYDVYYDSSTEYVYAVGEGDKITREKMDGSEAASFGSGGSDVNQFSNPAGIWYDESSEYFYISDSGNNRVVKTKFDGTGWTTLSGFSNPIGLQYDPLTEYIYVADAGNDRIVKTKIDGSGWTVLSGMDAIDVSYDPLTEYIYVADAGNDRIVKTKIDGSGWEEFTLDPRRTLMKTQGDEMRLELDLYSQRLKFWMKKDTGGIYLESDPLSWGIDDWHKVAVYFNKANGTVQLKIDDEVVDEAVDMTWTTDLPEFGDYIYLSSDPANPDSVNVSPVDDFNVNAIAVDTIEPTNPTQIEAYGSNSKNTQFETDTWINDDSPYFEFSGASDDDSGLKGYWVYFGSDETADPITAGDYQAHNGEEGAIQVYTPNIEMTTGETYYLIVKTRDNDLNYTSEATTGFVYKYDGDNPEPPEYINVSPVGCSTSSVFNFSWEAPGGDDSGIAGYDYRNGSTGNIRFVLDTQLEIPPYQEGDNILYVRSKDNAGNTSGWQTSVYCSTGVAHIVEGPEVKAGPSSIKVNWTSDKLTTSYVKVKRGNQYVSEQGHTDYSYNHEVQIVGLKPEKSYKYQLRWVDSNGNANQSPWYTTNTSKAPTVEDLKIEVLSPDKAIVSWNTSYPAQSVIEYGIGDYTKSYNMGEAATKFAHQLTGLSGGEDYRFRVKATYQDGTEFFGAQNFSTPPYPRISNLRFEPTKNSPSAGVNVTWDTNVKTSSAVNLTNNEGKGKSVSSAEMNKKHSLTIEGLTDQTEYQLIASGRDEYGNQAVSDIQTFTTQEDSRPPIITNTKLETSIIGIGAESKAQIVVSWQTDEPATSQVEYGIGVGGGSYQSSTMEDSSLTKTHTVIISELDPARTYHLRAVSKDGAGNLTKGDDNVIITGKKKDSVLDIILEKLRDTFGFLGNIRETLGV